MINAAHIGWQYNTSIQAVHIVILSNVTSIINKLNAPILLRTKFHICSNRWLVPFWPL